MHLPLNHPQSLKHWNSPPPARGEGTRRARRIAHGIPSGSFSPFKKCLTKEQTMNYVLPSFREEIMFRAVVEEAAALASISLFLGMIAIWAQVLTTL